MTRTLVVDLQGFKLNGNRFIFKEVAILDCTTLTQPKLYGLVFDAPFPYQVQDAKEKRQPRWTESHLGHAWDEKGIPYASIGVLLKAYLFAADQIFVKGSEKKQWLQEFVPPTCQLDDLHDLGCPRLKTLIGDRDAESMRRSMLHVCLLFDWLCHYACRDMLDMCKKPSVASESNTAGE